MSGRALSTVVNGLLAEQAAQLPQKDELCGPFWGLVVLRAAGIAGGSELDQDAVAVAAGSRLSPPPRDGSRPPGESGRCDYRLTLPIDAADPGTSAAGVAHAIGLLSAGRLTVVPVTGAWRVEQLRALLDGLSAPPPAVPLAVIANLDTGALWPVDASDSDLARYLATGDHGELASGWSIGHFAALIGYEHGAAGTLVEVADTYRSRAVHRQPIERVAVAIGGGQGKPRGLLIVTRDDPGPIRALAADAGLQTRLWDSLLPVDAHQP